MRAGGVPDRKDGLLNIAKAIFPDNTGHFVSSPRACVLCESRVTRVHTVSSAGAEGVPAPAEERRRIAVQFSGGAGRDAEEPVVKRGALIRCLRPYRLIRLLYAL